MPYKFEHLDVWKLALDYIDLVYRVVEHRFRKSLSNSQYQVREDISVYEDDVLL
jgi:hypothetical protein